MANTMEHLTETLDFGIELEFSYLDRGGYNFTKEFRELFPNYTRQHDASCETRHRYSLNDIPVSVTEQEDANLLSRLSRKEIIIGGEIVSPILSDKHPWIDDIYKLCDLLWRYGESSEESVRDSLHVHVNVGKTAPLEKIKNVLILHNQLEAIFYRLGGMGKVNRGIDNAYAYQRPYLGNSPPVVKVNKYYYPIFDVEDLLNSESKQDFFDRLGDSNFWYARGKKYVTQRYMGLNLYSIPYFGTVEFRHANKTLIPEYIIAWVHLCIAFCKVCDNTLKKDIYRPLHENREIPDKEFCDILERLPLENTDRSILLEIWQKSPTPTYDNLWRLSHLSARNQATFFEEGVYKTKRLSSRIDVQPPIHVDIHNIRNREIQPERVPEQFFDEDLVNFDLVNNPNETISPFWRRIITENYGLDPTPYTIISSRSHTDIFNRFVDEIEETGILTLNDMELGQLNIEGIYYVDEYSVFIYFTNRVTALVVFINDEFPHYYGGYAGVDNRQLNIDNLYRTFTNNRDDFYGEYDV